MDQDIRPKKLKNGNKLERFSHGARFALAVGLVDKYEAERLLDYGSGSGYFLDLIQERLNISGIGYDPFSKNERILRSLDGISGNFDCITIPEVLEHLDDEAIDSALDETSSLLSPDGIIIISVPVMVGLAGFFKIAKEFFGSQLEAKNKYTLQAAIKSLLGMRQERFRNKNGIYFHLGFNHRYLERMLFERFSSVTVVTSPFSALPPGLNSQVFYIVSAPK